MDDTWRFVESASYYMGNAGLAVLVVGIVLTTTLVCVLERHPRPHVD